MNEFYDHLAIIISYIIIQYMEKIDSRYTMDKRLICCHYLLPSGLDSISTPDIVKKFPVTFTLIRWYLLVDRNGQSPLDWVVTAVPVVTASACEEREIGVTLIVVLSLLFIKDRCMF